MRRSAMRREYPSQPTGVRHSFLFPLEDDCVLPLRILADRKPKVNYSYRMARPPDGRTGRGVTFCARPQVAGNERLACVICTACKSTRATRRFAAAGSARDA